MKSNDELSRLLEGRDDVFVIACNKCFKEYSVLEEPECKDFIAFAAGMGKAIAGSIMLDFLCNKTHTAKRLETTLPPGVMKQSDEAEPAEYQPQEAGEAPHDCGESITKISNVFVISCGLGVQTVADLLSESAMPSLPVFTAADSIEVSCTTDPAQSGRSLAGSHGMALTGLRCDACAQCYLNHTGGVCPIID